MSSKLVDSNGDSPHDKMNETLRLLVESNRKKWEEHDRIWQAVGTLPTEVKSLVGSIGKLIDRILPGNLR